VYSINKEKPVSSVLAKNIYNTSGIHRFVSQENVVGAQTPFVKEIGNVSTKLKIAENNIDLRRFFMGFFVPFSFI